MTKDELITKQQLEIERLSESIEYLIDNGEFEDIETAYNVAMNSIQSLKGSDSEPSVFTEIEGILSGIGQPF